MQTLRNQLKTHLSPDDLQDLCYDFGIDYETLEGETWSAKIRNVMRLCQARQQEDRVNAWLITNRPDVTWLTNWSGQFMTTAVVQPPPPPTEPTSSEIQGDFVSGSKVMGDSVSGNKTNITYDNRVQKFIHQYQVATNQDLDPEILERELRRYLEWLHRKTAILSIPFLAEKRFLTMAQGFLPLNATVNGSQQINLTDLLQYGQYLAVTGEIGSGKTTALFYIAWSLSEAFLSNDPAIAQERLGLTLSADEPLPFPIFLPLSGYADFYHQTGGHQPRNTLATFVSHYLLESQARFTLPSDFFAQIIEKSNDTCILLLDGLDEVSNAQDLAHVSSIVEGLSKQEHLRVVVTCRTVTYDYLRQNSRLSDYENIFINSLNTALVEQLVDQTYQHLYPETVSVLTQTTATLQAMRQMEREFDAWLLRPGQIAPLITTPLLATQFMKASQSETSNLRAQFYNHATQAIVFANYAPDSMVQERLGRLMGVNGRAQLDILQYIAYQFHKNSVSHRWVQREEIERLFDLPEGQGFQADVNSLLSLTALRGTLLQKRKGMEQYRFAHLGFQAFLTARYLAETVRDIDDIMAFLFSDQMRFEQIWWREVILLLVGYFALTAKYKAVSLVQRLSGTTEENDWHLQLKTNSLLRVLELSGTALAEANLQHYQLKRTVQAKLLSCFLEPVYIQQAEPRLRIQLGVALGKLSDPRETVIKLHALEFCYIPRPSEEVTQRGLPTYSFWMSEHPVSQAQFARFVQAGGYQEARFWTEAKAHGVWENGFIKDTSSGRTWVGPRQGLRQPEIPLPFVLPNHPATGLCWYEALAFCRWMTELWRTEGVLNEAHLVTLPTAVEWVIAAQGWQNIPNRPYKTSSQQAYKFSSPPTPFPLQPNPYPQRKYPWGNRTPTPQQANFNRTRVNATTPIGSFPQGVSPYGCLDMSGNVQEWTCTAVQGSATLTNPTPDTPMVLKGGFYKLDAQALRIEFQTELYPNYVDKATGLRLVIVPTTAAR